LQLTCVSLFTKKLMLHLLFCCSGTLSCRKLILLLPDTLSLCCLLAADVLQQE